MDRFRGEDWSPYDYSDLDEVVLAYAVSVHKSQGSDYPVVDSSVVTQHYDASTEKPDLYGNHQS